MALPKIVHIISHRRSSNVKRMQEFIGSDFLSNWIVGDYQDASMYDSEGANKITIGGSLTESRNLAIKLSESVDEDCIMIDDDLKSLALAQSKSSKDNQEISLKMAIHLMYQGFEITNNWFYLAGVAPTINPFFYNPEKPYSLNHFIGGWMTIIRKGAGLYFDPNLKTKEDYDYTLQHIQKYGGAVRCNQILANFQHYGNKGGVVDTRTAELEQESIAYLKQKWGDIIRDNPKRPNEILLKH